jgi:PhnB protein
MVKPIPDGYPTLTPYLVIDGATAAIAFYAKAFGAKERMRLGAPGGRISHAEIEIGGSVVMLADEFPDMGARGPKSVGGSPVHLHLYVADVDAAVAQAVAAGAEMVRQVQDQFYGDRSGTLRDPFGHIWHVATHVEDVSQEEIERRAAAMHAKG